MADDGAAARREARRRKILGNSHNRLQYISGKTSNECIKVSESANKSPIPDQNIDPPTIPEKTSSSHSQFLLSSVNGSLVTETESYNLLTTSQDDVAADDAELSNDLTTLTGPPTESEPRITVFEKIITYKYDIVILSVVMQLLCSCSLLNFDNGYFFLPVIIHVFTKLIWFPAHTKSNLAKALFLLDGVSASRIEKILNASQWVNVISQDICVYLFTTICMQAVIVTIKNNFGA